VQVLAVGGVLLIIVGGLLLYPYVHSRLPSSHPALPATGVTPIVGEGMGSPLDVPTSEYEFTFIPTHVPTSVPTPVPAVPDRLFISAIKLDAPVAPVTRTMIWANGQKQPTFKIPQARVVGWHETSAPLGVPGNTVLNGHNTGFGEVFRDLYKVKEKDTILVYSGEASYHYVVTQILVLPEIGEPLEVRVKNASYIQPSEDEQLTLVTCHPYGSLRNRLVVIAHPAEVGD
jgi:sortase A